MTPINAIIFRPNRPNDSLTKELISLTEKFAVRYEGIPDQIRTSASETRDGTSSGFW
jgi:hypothetical protein